MKISLWTAKALIGVTQALPGVQPVPSRIVAGAITGLTTADRLALERSSYLSHLNDLYYEQCYCGQRAWFQYHHGIKILREPDADNFNAAAKFAIVFFSLCEADQITDDKLDLFTETFLHLEKNKLPESEIEEYSKTFITLVENGATYKELTLFAHSAVSLIQSGKPIDELINNMHFAMNRSSAFADERTELITSYCNQATENLDKTYETSVNKVARYITYIPKAVAGIAGKIALILFG